MKNFYFFFQFIADSLPSIMLLVSSIVTESQIWPRDFNISFKSKFIIECKNFLMMNCFVARQSGPDGMLKFDLLCWTMTSFSDNSLFMIIYLYYRSTYRLWRWPGLFCAIRNCPNIHKENLFILKRSLFMQWAQLLGEHSEMEEWILAALNCISRCTVHFALWGRNAGRGW